jgi:hypothetical protein
VKHVPHILDRRLRSRLILATGIAVGLAVLNWYLLTSEIDISPIAPPEAVAEPEIASAAIAEDAGAKTEQQTFPQTLARPLFRSSRRPAETEKPRIAARPQAAPNRPARLPEGLELVGIMKADGKAGKALLRMGGSPGEWVEVGHVLQGWRISQIDAASILFEAEGRHQSLSLFPPKSE